MVGAAAPSGYYMLHFTPKRRAMTIENKLPELLFLERLSVDSIWRAAILIGVLGGFTTFSSFSIETFNLIESGELVKAGLNMALSLVLCITATWLGAIIGRQL